MNRPLKVFLGAIAVLLVIAAVVGKQLPEQTNAKSIPAPASVIQSWDKKIILASAGKQYRKYLVEDEPGSKYDGYVFGEPGPHLKLEFRSNRINVAITLYPEAGYEAKNAEVLKIAKSVVSTISGGDGAVVQDVLDGKTKGEFSINDIKASATPPSLGSTLLTFYYP